MNAKYKEYLLSPTWAAIKLDLLHSRGSRCERCQKKTKWLQVHHLTYERIFHEEPEDLQLVCAPCHKKEHGITDKNKKPKINGKKSVIIKNKNYHKPKQPKGNKKSIEAGKKGFSDRVEKYSKKNPVEKVLRRQKQGLYKNLLDFNTAFNCAVRRCKRFGIPYKHLIELK